MKKILLFIAIAVAAIACKKDETPVTPEIKVLSTAYELAVPYEVSDLTIKIESTVDWTAEFKDAASAEVCDFTPKSGVAGAATIAVTFEANADKVDREAVIVITAGTATAEVKVTQGLKVVANPAEPAAIPVAGGSVNVTIESNTEYVVTPATNDWLTVTNDGDVYTFTATANAAFNGRSVEVIVAPTNEAYADYATSFVIAQDGKAKVLWSKSLADYSAYTVGNSVRLAYKDDMLLISNGTAVHALDAATGAYSQAIPVPANFNPNSMVNDDAGNVLLAMDAPTGATFTVFRVSALTDIQTPTPIISYANGNWCNKISRLQVEGDVTKNAVVTAFSDLAQLAYVWEINNGVAGDCICKAIGGLGTAWNTEYSMVTPLGNTLAGGFMFNGYVTDTTTGKYEYKYCADIAANTWTNIYTAYSAGNEAPGAMSTARVGDKTFVACVEYGYAAGTASRLYVLDVTAPTSPVCIYEAVPYYNADADGIFGGDVLSVVKETSVVVYRVDNLYKTIEAIEFPMN